MAPLEMNAGTCWEQEYNRPNGLSVEKLQKATFIFTFTFMLCGSCMWLIYTLLNE